MGRSYQAAFHGFRTVVRQHNDDERFNESPDHQPYDFRVIGKQYFM